MEEQHIYHHTDESGPRVNTTAERNTKGWNYSATVLGAGSPVEAVALLMETLARLEAELRDKPLNG